MWDDDDVADDDDDARDYGRTTPCMEAHYAHDKGRLVVGCRAPNRATVRNVADMPSSDQGAACVAINKTWFKALNGR